MHMLSADDVIRMWELGQRQDALERAITILAVAFPDTPCEVLASLSLGRRNARLLQVREQLIGNQLDGFAECPRCSQHLEFALDAAALWSESAVASQQEIYTLESGDLDLRYRLPDTEDLAAAAACADLESARRLLAQRCVLRVRRQGMVLSDANLPEEVIARLAAQLAELDPLADVQLSLQCPACCHEWEVGLDLGEFLWTELGALAKRLLREVHILARAYGWREADILSLSTVRRQFYLELAL